MSERFSQLKYAVYVYLGAVSALFAMFYPILSGTAISKSYVATYLRWFQSWVQSPGLKVKFLFHDSLSASIMILADCIAREGWREYRIRLCQSKY